ncbi:MAG: hypothetical protein LBP63_08840 [Prevotellaceae bacterium]|jgi:hypothetical protein|nr:hypothetical protein [Prevotellaceae bacterium]
MNMLKTNIMLALFFAVAVNTHAQNSTYAVGARSAGMGNAGAAKVDVWSTVTNQAALTLLPNVEISAYYKNSFGMSELSLNALSVAIPTKAGVFSGLVAHFGFSEYSENKFAVAYAKRIWRMLSLSAQINCNSLHFTNAYQNATAISGEVGLFADLADNFYVGAHVSNPVKSSLSIETKKYLPVRYKIGTAYKPISSLLMCADFIYDDSSDVSFCGGMEYFLLEQLCLRAGASVNPELFTLGAGYRYQQFNFDVAFNYHNVLGNISSISISYKFNKK